MQVQQAKQTAREWVETHGTQTPGFVGAFFHGSINGLAPDAVLSASSDVDVMLVLADDTIANKLGKFVYNDTLLEVSHLPESLVASPELVLGNYHLAPSFRSAGIIADPTNHLTLVQQAAAENFAKRFWVTKRCQHAESNLRNGIARLHTSEYWDEQVTAWLFPAGITTHILLVAGLKNPTVRRRYVAVRDLLTEYGLSSFYETLLGLLGCTDISPDRVTHHLAHLAETFDTAKTWLQTPFPFAADLTNVARPIVIDGSQELIDQGLHRGAIFWMVATFCRCLGVLRRDAPVEVQAIAQAMLGELLADLGISSFADLERSAEQTRALLPRVWETAEQIMDKNPDIESTGGSK